MSDFLSQHEGLLTLVFFLLFTSTVLGVLLSGLIVTFKVAYKIGPVIIIGAVLLYILHAAGTT